MFPLSLKMYAYIAVLAVLAALAVAVKVQTSRLATAKAETVAVQGKFDAFVAQAKALGDAQNAKAKAIEVADKQRKEQADYDNAKTKRDLAGVYAAYRKLRDQRGNSGSGFLPPTTPGSASPATASFDRTGLDRALSGFDSGVTGLLERGDQAIVDLNTAKTWAQTRPQRDR